MPAEVRRSSSGGEGKIIITGPGRSGTTLLVRLLTGMGLDTREEELRVYGNVNAGLEIMDPARPNTPRVIKSPQLTEELPRMLADGRVQPTDIDHVLLPVRDLETAAASRVKASVEAGIPKVPGGMWGTSKPQEQKWFLAEAFYGLIEALARYEIPFTVLAFPRFAEDCDYAFRTLSFLNPDVTSEQFAAAWAERVDRSLIHQPGPEQWSRKQRLRLKVSTIERRVKFRVRKLTKGSPNRKR